MTLVPLGPQGLRVSDFCLGTMTWGRQTAPEAAYRQIDRALERGINFLDTAEMYPTNPVLPETLGGTEAIIGDWIARGGDRDRLIIATKVTGEGSGVIPGGSPRIDAARLRQAVEDSLRRLRCGRIDLYQLHWPDRGSYHFRRNWHYVPRVTDKAAVLADMRGVLETAAALIAEGKIGALALSNETAWGVSQWCTLSEREGLPRIASVQNEYSLLCRTFDTDMAEACTAEEVPLLAFSPLATGLLTGKYAGDVTPEGSRRAATPDLGGRITPRVFEAVAAYLNLAREWSIDPVAMALCWHRTRPFRSIPIIGATTEEQLERQLDAFDMTLPEGLTAAIDAVHKSVPMPF